MKEEFHRWMQDSIICTPYGKIRSFSGSPLKMYKKDWKKKRKHSKKRNMASLHQNNSRNLRHLHGTICA